LPPSALRSAPLTVYLFLLETRAPPPPPPPAQRTQRHPAPAPNPAPPGTGPPATPAPSTVPGATATQAAPGAGAETREQALAEQPRVKIDTPRLHGSVSLVGGRIDDLTLANYHETPDPKSPEVVLLWPSGTKDPYFAEFGWVAGTQGAKVPGSDTRWTASGDKLSPNAPLTLTWDNGAGLVFTRTIWVDANYMFTVRNSVRNTGNAPVSLLPYGLVSRTGAPDGSAFYISHEGLAGYLDGHVFGGGTGVLWLGDNDTFANLAPDKPRDYTS